MTAPQPPSTSYGLLAEFDNPTALLAAAEKATAAGYTKTDAFSPFPIHGLADALGFREQAVAPKILAGGIAGAVGGFGLQVPVAGHRVPDEHRRPADVLVGVLHSADVRDDGAFCGVLRRLRHAGAKRTAATVSPGVQRAAVCAGEPGPILPGHRGGRPEVRSRTDGRVSDGLNPREVVAVDE